MTEVSGIVYDARRVLAYERMLELGRFAQKSEEFIAGLWEEVVLDEALLKEFVYYVDNHTFLDEAVCRGYTMTDLYVWQMDRYNLIRDIGKNTSACNKEALVLNTFRSMLDMKKNPDAFVKKLTKGTGMDQIY